jgi:hypothetical protein
MGNRFMKRFLSQLAELYAEGSHMARVALLHLGGARGVYAGEVNVPIRSDNTTELVAPAGTTRPARRARCSRTSAQLVQTVC